MSFQYFVIKNRLKNVSFLLADRRLNYKAPRATFGPWATGWTTLYYALRLCHLLGRNVIQVTTDFVYLISVHGSRKKSSRLEYLFTSLIFSSGELISDLVNALVELFIFLHKN